MGHHMEISIELKPCPFCGNEATTYAAKFDNKIGCGSVECVGFHERNMGYATMEFALEEWNKRDPITEKTEREYSMLSDEYDRLKSINAELVGALKACLDEIKYGGKHDAAEIAERALKSATEGNK